MNDRHLLEKDAQEGLQDDDGIEINVLRLSSAMPWKIRLNNAKQFTAKFNPHWISLQFVPFGFQIKGLPFKLGNKLKYLSEKARWHVMFHELSVNKNESLKFKCWSFLQIVIIQSLLHHLKPLLITTNTQIYKCRLHELKQAAMLLPLFSNIKKSENNSAVITQEIIPEDLCKNRKNYLVGTLFGSFSSRSWDMRSLLNNLSEKYKNKKVVIASVGKMSEGFEYWKILEKEYSGITFLTLGLQDAEFISHWLTQFTDFGILTTLPELAGKSGSFMAFKEHGIPVVCKKINNTIKRNCIVAIDEVLVEIKENDTPFSKPPKYIPVSVLNTVTDQYFNALNSLSST